VSSPSTPAWEARFRSPVSWLPEWSPHAPERVVYASTESGVWQIWAWDLGTGRPRRVTDHPVGVLEGCPTLDGSGVLWFQDETGDESGAWMLEPFEGGDPRPFLEGVPRGWSGGLAQAPGIVAVALSDADGFAVHVSIEGAAAREIYRASESVLLGGIESGGFLLGALSADGSLLCLEHAEHGDLIHAALRVIDPRDGSTVGDLVDQGMRLAAKAWSPVPGDRRLAIEHEREGEERPAIWDLATGERTDLALELDGSVSVHDWWPDGSALLLVSRVEGRDNLMRYDLDRRELRPLPTEPGIVMQARVRPDGRVWLVHEQGHRQRLVLDDEGVVLLELEGDRAPPGRPYVSWHVENPHGQRVHGFHVTPDDSGGPFPTLMFVHGGPSSLDMDRWQPEVQAYVDAGFLVGMVNYRGSTGYGREWRDSLIRNIGGPELEDVNAGLADLVARGLADPERAVVGGHSWGGYITLLELGKHPELWRCGVAGVPVADYVESFDDMSPLLQEYDRALLGGAAPAELPDLMRERNPIEFADQVRAPVLILVGRNDSRCPYRQVMLYVDKLSEREHPHELYVFDTGHASFDVEERIRQVRTILGFLARHLPGVAVPGDPPQPE
jgi:dipeptidyl aminopeptidase/acylaminoacyl peptidase